MKTKQIKKRSKVNVTIVENMVTERRIDGKNKKMNETIQKVLILLQMKTWSL